MKTLIIPFSILLITASCYKQNMPQPASEFSARTPKSTHRLSGDTLVRIKYNPSEYGPVINEKPEVIKP